ncbi:hypothetical protein BDW22DRAFT_1413754 [Trametopsis cervina]|nr:hypothetical protein BDW22DRAFT_1413754 [Trametopsis cervina]
MQLATAPPLLFAIGVRLFLNFINPEHTTSTADHILAGIWQGVLLHYTLRHLGALVFPLGFAIAAKLLYDFSHLLDATRCACGLLGIALGVLFTDILAQLFEDGRINERKRSDDTGGVGVSSGGHARDAHAPPSKRLRLVSFERERERERDRDRKRASRDKGKGKQREDAPLYPPPQPPQVEELPPRTHAASPSPTHGTTHTIDSLPSSLDLDPSLSPAARTVALLRARASLADSERRRFKEERKWAISQGNTARASQLEWQVRRYTELMKSFHREADAKVVEAAPLVSVTVGGGASRSRKRTGTGSALKPAIFVHNRDGTTRRS